MKGLLESGELTDITKAVSPGEGLREDLSGPPAEFCLPTLSPSSRVASPASGLVVRGRQSSGRYDPDWPWDALPWGLDPRGEKGS